MGILDDAIREHLDLKRRLGAEDSELARLEDEAFGPPSRPGDPDFPEQRPTGEEAAVAEPVTGEVATQTAPAPGDAPPSEPIAPSTSEAPAQPAPTERPISGSAAEPAPVEPSASEPAASPPTGEEQPPAGGFYDHQSDELDLDLDLDDDQPAAATEPASEELGVVPEPSAVPETTDQPAVEPPSSGLPIESQDTVEHHFEGALGTGETDVVEPPPETGEAGAVQTPLETSEAEVVEGPIEDTGEAEVVEGELADEDDDVLEETPEFLRDQPEDDELWFEQGEPKDFDF